MHAELNVRFELSIDEDKTVPLAALAEFVTEQNVESVLLEALVESLDAGRVRPLGSRRSTLFSARRGPQLP
jgi:hypothetical protein